jgi:hypothetical protein
MTSIAKTTAVSIFMIFLTCVAVAQQNPPGISDAEQAVCRADAIKFCFFSLASADAVRACLRSNKPSLSAPCQKLLTSRGN